MAASEDTESLNTQMSNLDVKDKIDKINILLLGSTGVGKSTFINSIANYLSFRDLKTAEKEAPFVLIPTQYTIKDKHDKSHSISIGQVDNNESLDIGESATQDVKTYVFPIWDNQLHVRLIDTPGIGDTRGIIKDDENSENILSYIANLDDLHAICFLLKPNESRSTVYFKYCMSQILSRLEKSASNNILFVFTNTRGTDYGPGDTMSILKRAVEEIQSKPPYCQIPLNRNVFCLENEAFKYLHAVKKDVEFDSSYAKIMSASWKNSMEQCWQLINYIVGDAKHAPLKPHVVKSTSAINEARRMITHLSQPLADISQLINQNVSLLDRHKRTLNIDQNSVEELKKKLYMPVVNLEVINLTQPVTVCTDRNCAEIYKVGDTNSWHYKQRCHDPCYLRNVPKEIIGSPELVHCAAMSNKQCVKCGCQFSIHMHVYYLTKVKEDREIDSNIQRNIYTKEKVIENAVKILKRMEIKKAELEGEHQTILTCCAKFAHFLKNNAITPYNDAYAEYIKYLIDREKSLGYLCDMGTVRYLEKLLCQYEEMKKSFDDALKLNIKLNRSGAVVTAEEIQDSIQSLYDLKHNGKTIKDLYDCQTKSRRKEFDKNEYVHKLSLAMKESKQKQSKQRSSNEPPPTYAESEVQHSRNRRRNDDNNYSRNRGNTWGNHSSRRNEGPRDNYNSRNAPPRDYSGNQAPRNEYPGPGYGNPPREGYQGPRDYYMPQSGYYPPPPGQYPPSAAPYPPQHVPPRNYYPPEPQYPSGRYDQEGRSAYNVSITVHPNEQQRRQEYNNPPTTSHGNQPPPLMGYNHPNPNPYAYWHGPPNPGANYGGPNYGPPPPSGYHPREGSYGNRDADNRNYNRRGHQQGYNSNSNRARRARGGGIQKNTSSRRNNNRNRNTESDGESDESQASRY